MFSTELTKMTTPSITKRIPDRSSKIPLLEIVGNRNGSERQSFEAKLGSEMISKGSFLKQNLPKGAMNVIRSYEDCARRIFPNPDFEILHPT